MVTKAKKALLASLAAFLCVMLTVFGLSMSVSLSETAKAADETPAEVAEVNSVKFATLAEAVNAVSDGGEIVVYSGVYTIPDVTYTGKSFTISAGVDQTVSFDMSVAHAIHGAKVSFNNVTFDYKTNNNYIGLQHADTLTYNGCTINGMVFLYATNETFNDCTFNQTSKEAYNVWTYGAKNVAFNRCVFKSAGKSVLVYNEGANLKTDLTVSETKFVASEKVDGKAAIEIDTSLMAGGTTITIDDKTTATNFAAGSNSGNTLWNDKKQTADTNKNTTITVADEVVFAPYVVAIGEVKYFSLTAAIAAAKDGETVKLLADVEQNSEVSINKNITLDLNGKKIYNTKDIWNETVSLIDIEGGAKVTVMGDGTIAAKKDDCYTINITDGDLTIENGTFVGNISVVQVVKGKLTINGGTFSLLQKWKGEDRYLINCIDKAFTDKEAKVAIYGGSFAGFDPNVSPEAKVDGKVPSFAAPGVGITKNVDGSFTAKANMAAQILDSDGNSVAAYATLEEAVNAAAKAGDTITLLADTGANVTIAKKLTLDLNGYTINGGTVKATPTILVSNCTVTITDSSKAKTGTVMREDTAENSGVSSHYVIDIQGKNGFLIVEGGNFVNNSGAGGTKGASLIRLGDDRVSAWPTLTIKGGTFTQDNFIVLKVDRGTLHFLGGTLNSAKSYAVENWNNAYIKGGTINGAVSSWVYSGGAAFSKLEISAGTINGDVESVSYDGSEDKQARVYITGGTVTGTLSNKVYSGSSEVTTAMATIEVTGGTFDIDPSKYITEAAVLDKTEDGKFGVKKVVLAEIVETGVQYYTMDEAFHAVNAGETIKLLRNYTTDKVQNSGSKSFTIDLGGFTWTYTRSDADCAAFEINYPDVTLTVKNGTVVSNSMIGLIPSAMSGTITYNNAGLIFENVNMTAKGHSGFETNGNNVNDTITLIGGELHVDNGYGIYFASTGTLTINGTKIFAKTMGVQICSGSLVISGDSEITVTGDAVTKTENDGAIEDGAAISIVNRPGYKGLSDIVITGGTFTAKAGNDAIKAYDWNNAENKGSDFTKADLVAVSGGTFSSEVKKDYLAKGYRLTKTGESYGVTAKYIESTHVSLGTALSFSYKLRVLNEGETIKNAKASYRTVRGNLVEIDMTLVDGYYVFDGITPQMLDRKISVNVYIGDTVVYDVVDYSILDYLQDLLNTELGKATVTKQLVADLAFYGKAAMKYVGYTTTVVDKFIADNGLTQSTGDITGLATSEGTEKVANVSVQFASQNKILIGVAESVFDDYSYTIKVNGTEIDKALWQTDVVDGYRVYVSDGFAASYITDKDHYVEVEVLKNGASVQKVQCNVAGYCMKMAENAKMGELAKATYYYGVSAAEYANFKG